MRFFGVLFAAFAVLGVAIEQVPQRVGMQRKSYTAEHEREIEFNEGVDFQFLDSLWIDGGRRLNYDGSDSGQGLYTFYI